MKVLIINGPNLNMLGVRSLEIYGSETLGQINGEVQSYAESLDVSCEFFQSNCEGSIIDAIHGAYGKVDGIIINAGAYTHYSYAIADALECVSLPVVEVHLSDIHNREDFRKISVLEEVCVAQISGFGRDSYVKGMEKLNAM